MSRASKKGSTEIAVKSLRVVKLHVHAKFLAEFAVAEAKERKRKEMRNRETRCE